MLVSGNGDGAVIELAHLLIEGFDHENIFSFLPSNALAPRLSTEYAAAVAALSHRRIEYEHASREIDLCLNYFRLGKILRRTTRTLFRNDIEVVVTGYAPTIYSIAQAPLKWFLLRLLMHDGALSYHPTQLVRSRLVKNLVQCEFKDRSLNGSFHRVIARQGPVYVGLSSDPRLRSEREVPEEAPLPEYFMQLPGRQISARRLLQAQRHGLELSDGPDPGLGTERGLLRDADTVLWACHGLPQMARATKLYRQLKSSRSFKTRAGLCSHLLEVALDFAESDSQSNRRGGRQRR